MTDTLPSDIEETKYYIMHDRDYNNNVIVGVANTLEEANRLLNEIKNIHTTYRQTKDKIGYVCESDNFLNAHILVQKFRNGIAVGDASFPA